MPKTLNITILVTFLCIFSGTWLTAQTPVTEEEENLDDPIIPLEEAMAAIDRIAPLPTEKKDAEYDAVPLVFPDETEPDFIYLKYLQIQERIAEREALEATNNSLLYDNFFKLRQSPEVCDPLEILTHSEYQVLQDLVLSYSENSQNPVFVNLLKKEQLKLLIGIPHDQHESALSKYPNGVMVYYFYDRPERTRVYFGKSASQTIPYEKQRVIISNALKHTSNQESAFDAIYQHLTSLTNDLSDHNKSIALEGITPKNEEVPSTTSHLQMEATPSYPKEQASISHKDKSPPPLTLILGLLLGGIILCSVFLFMHTKNQKRQHRILISPQEPTLEFEFAKDTSQAIEFHRNKSA